MTIEFSLIIQFPQVLVLPCFKLVPDTTFSFPQSHLQSQYIALEVDSFLLLLSKDSFVLSSSDAITVNFPNFCPIKSLYFPICTSPNR